MTKNARENLNMFINMLGKKIVQRAVDLNHSINRFTLSCKDILSAMSFEFPRELGNHATLYARHATTRYFSINKATRAGLQFPPPRARKLIMGYWRNHIGEGTSICLAAILEYVCKEIVELSGNTTRDRQRVRIDTRSLFFGNKQ